MQKNSQLYDLTQNMQAAIFRAAFQNYLISLEEEGRDRPSLPRILQLRGGYAESPAWIMVQVAEFLPEPLTVEKFRRRAVYSAPGLIQGFLELLASEKYLDRIGEEYYVTDTGREVIDMMTLRRTSVLTGFEPLPRSDLDRLENLMSRVIDASLQAGDPPGIWCLEHSRRRAPSESSPPMVKIVRYCSDLNAFRDDSHMAAHRPYDVDGRTWEAFSCLNQGTAKTAEELFDQLAYRGFSRTEWAQSLDGLVQRGWLEESSGEHTVTDTGKTIYDAVERQTDAYFYGPWDDALSEAEFDELCQLTQRLHDRSEQTE
jgi:hypothetical protein